MNAQPQPAKPKALPKQSVFAQLRPTPRIFYFFAIMLIASGTLGGREVARFQYLNRFFDSESIVGFTAAATATTIAISSFLVGRLIDRTDPRPFLNWSLALSSLTLLLPAVALSLDFMTTWLVVALAAFDGILIGAFAVSLFKTQALLVEPTATGAAEILNLFRLGVGGFIGALIAGLSPSPEVTLYIGAVALVVTAILIWAITHKAPIRLPTHTPTGVARALPQGVLAYLKASSLIRQLVVLDLVLALVIPTQLVNFVLFDYDAEELASRSIAAGLAGVFIGRVLLAFFGFRGSPRSIVFATTLGLATLQVIAAISLINDWVLGQEMVVPLLVLLGSVLAIYCQGLFGAMLQQEMAEEMRGRLSAILVTGRNIAIGAGALIGAAVITPLGSQQLLLVLSASLVVVAIASGGYRALKPL